MHNLVLLLVKVEPTSVILYLEMCGTYSCRNKCWCFAMHFAMHFAV